MTNHGIVTDGASDLAALRAENLRLREALERITAINIGDFQEPNIILCTWDVGGPAYAQRMRRLSRELNHAIRIANNALSTPAEAPEPVADESGGEGSFSPAGFAKFAADMKARRAAATPPNPTTGDAVREELEEAAKVAECAFDDRPNSRAGHPSQMDWTDGYRDGTRAAAAAIRATLAKHGGAEG